MKKYLLVLCTSCATTVPRGIDEVHRGLKMMDVGVKRESEILTQRIRTRLAECAVKNLPTQKEREECMGSDFGPSQLESYQKMRDSYNKMVEEINAFEKEYFKIRINQ